ncbi:hypothetical protein M422DRAFT_51922 [Sphaerobolus stellatus SS14]|uniref:MARVEL domain-containing protein n=1 Tax=Sphaerobolus stellatus (strain SS14) TaxID=990650 RepID=A0A0C9UIJ7_SPHS4|nr:hypothetical protein M422DRAFT_51922 [Sphaerobolus stellatus SS14]
MTSTFLTLRYVAFALFILFNAVICVVAALNLGSLATGTQKFPEVDAYLIFMGALAIVFLFPAIIVELFRKNAFISRVAVEITWVSIFWIMSLSGAAAMTAIIPELSCLPAGTQLKSTCASSLVLLAFTWLNTIILLAYLIVLIVCAVYHSQENNHVWQTGVRDFKWFSKQHPEQEPPEGSFTYGKIKNPKEPKQPPPVYAQQMGLSKGYQVEPLHIDAAGPAAEPAPPALPTLQNFQFPARPTPALQLNIQGSEPYRTILPPPANVTTPKPPLSLYPEFVQASGGTIPQPPRPAGPTPPPAGSWPRPNPQEPIRRKSRPARELPAEPRGPSSQQDPSGSSSAPRQLPSPPVTVQPSTTRNRPVGPRGSTDPLRVPLP